MSSNAILSTRPGPSAGETAILDAAIRLFSKEGFDRVSMRLIAEEAGVSKANIYHHFESKEALYIAILHASADRLSGLIENLAEGRGAFDERLRVFARAHLENLFDNATSVRLILRESFSGDEEKSRVMVEQFVGGIIRRLIDIFRRGQQVGLLRRELDPGLCAMLLLGSDLMYFQFYAMMKYLPEADFALDHAEFSREMMDVMLNGMLADAAEGEGAL
ncbi:MAG: TetR/AcrR family transcriptional regulator [Xanthomonadales bacterium]|nr:TetR/AcrR family transcriptional regulator [Xanthomonadales bacterium]